MAFENDATYTLPFAISGALNLASDSISLPADRLCHSKRNVEASKALSVPGTVKLFASPTACVVAQRMPVPAREPFAERAIMPPGMPSGGSTEPTATAAVSNLPLLAFKRYARRKSFSPQTYMFVPDGLFQSTTPLWM